MSTPNTAPYRGRFAPSPTGPLHLGSLVGALSSYLDARAHGGQWLLRIEDLDRRASSQASPMPSSELLRPVARIGMESCFNRARLEDYQLILERLLAANLAYRCSCSRQHIKACGGIYDGYRDNLRLINCSDSLRTTGTLSPSNSNLIRYHDCLQGEQQQDLVSNSATLLSFARTDCLSSAGSRRRYLSGITHVIRGCDLLDNLRASYGYMNKAKKPNSVTPPSLLTATAKS